LDGAAGIGIIGFLAGADEDSRFDRAETPAMEDTSRTDARRHAVPPE